MTATTGTFLSLLTAMGSTVTYHREEGGVSCPCLSPEGFRSPAWHKANPTQPMCNEQGKINQVITNLAIKAAIQPVRTSSRRASERALQLFGEVQEDDHIGVFPTSWLGTPIDFRNWSDAGEDYILYDGRRYIAIASDKLPDVDGDPAHHWEVALRLADTARPQF